MAKLVVQSDSERQVGQRYRGITRGPWGEPRPRQWYRVIAHATEEDWIECMCSIQGEEMRDHFVAVTKLFRPLFYYEIQTD